MGRGHEDDHNTRRTADTPDRRAAARFAREEVADVLAEALWSLICAGRWPGPGGSGARPAAAAAVRPDGADAPQPIETTGFESCFPSPTTPPWLSGRGARRAPRNRGG